MFFKEVWMTVSVFDIFSIGIGPSSSHTVGPMKAAVCYLEESKDFIPSITSVKIDLFGSLALTGKGHGTDIAILLGLQGYRPDEVDPSKMQGILDTIYESKSINLLRKKRIPFDPAKDICFIKNKTLPIHANALKIYLYQDDKEIGSKIYYSIGGGFIIDHETAVDKSKKEQRDVPYPFKTASELLDICKSQGLKIFEVILENEKVDCSYLEIEQKLLKIWDVMQESVEKGCQTDGILPGGLEVKRRAKEHMEALKGDQDDSSMIDFVSVWALAVNEENAAFGRVVTAPTNGAAGIIPSVLQYYKKYISSYSEQGVVAFLLTAAAICNLYKEGASISGAEMGCQGEIGVACSMAAAGLAEVMGGNNDQIESAAEIGMEHNLGLTCDPVRGLVQIPCIERNTMGAIKAINAARLAIRANGDSKVSLDQVILAMREIGVNMKSMYKETAQGGLATQLSEDKNEGSSYKEDVNPISVRFTAC